MRDEWNPEQKCDGDNWDGSFLFISDPPVREAFPEMDWYHTSPTKSKESTQVRPDISFELQRQTQKSEPDHINLAAPPSEDFVRRFRNAHGKAQRYTLIVGLMAVSLLPLIQNTIWRVAVLSLVMGLLIRLFLAFEEDARKRLDVLTNQTGSLVCRSRIERPTYRDFGECQSYIEKYCLSILEGGEDLRIDSLVVAAAFSWTYFREKLPEWSRAFPKSNIRFNIAMCTEEVLESWGARWWAGRVRNTAADIDSVRTRTKSQTNLQINAFRYDLILQQHGILINNRVLFTGRTAWILAPGEVPELRVGSRPYQKVESSDPSCSRIVADFRGWMHRAQLRHHELKPANASVAA